jgi:hypothetical protein
VPRAGVGSLGPHDAGGYAQEGRSILVGAVDEGVVGAGGEDSHLRRKHPLSWVIASSPVHYSTNSF